MEELEKDYCLVSLVGFDREFYFLPNAINRFFQRRCAVVGPRMDFHQGNREYSDLYRCKILQNIVKYAFPYADKPQSFGQISGRMCPHKADTIVSPRSCCETDLGRRACRDSRPGAVIMIWRPWTGSDWIIENLKHSLYLYRFDYKGDQDKITRIIIDIVEEHIYISKQVLRSEIHNNPSRTPLLLPPENFEPGDTKDFFWEFQNHKIGNFDGIEAYRTQWYNSRIRHAKGSKVGGFIDSREILFAKDAMKHYRRMPNIQNSLDEHLDLLDAFYRFGVPYEVGFHYDVFRHRHTKPRALNAQFWNRKTMQFETRRDLSINISPDDAIRD